MHIEGLARCLRGLSTTASTLVDAKMTRPNPETLMNTHWPRQLIALALNLTPHALMIGGVARDPA
jgi:hypothetical protein